jgi:hypothetical protein
MAERREVIVERMPDTGQWFEPGARAEYFPVERDPRQWTLEAAALGSYEVLDCHRVTTADGRWLDVRLQRLSFAGPGGGRPAVPRRGYDVEPAVRGMARQAPQLSRAERR